MVDSSHFQVFLGSSQDSAEPLIDFHEDNILDIPERSQIRGAGQQRGTARGDPVPDKLQGFHSSHHQVLQ